VSWGDFMVSQATMPKRRHRLPASFGGSVNWAVEGSATARAATG
jgi:hypothetical protein